MMLSHHRHYQKKKQVGKKLLIKSIAQLKILHRQHDIDEIAHRIWDNIDRLRENRREREPAIVSMVGIVMVGTLAEGEEQATREQNPVTYCLVAWWSAKTKEMCVPHAPGATDL